MMSDLILLVPVFGLLSRAVPGTVLCRTHDPSQSSRVDELLPDLSFHYSTWNYG